MAKAKTKISYIQIRLKRSPICCPESHKRVVRGLGFRKRNQTVERPDTPAIRGMVRKIPHLVEIVSGKAAS